MSITERALLVNLTLRQWSARKYDKKVSKKVTSDFGVSQDSGRWNKVLLAMDRIKEINSLCNELRSYHYSVTYPWTDEGYRILPATMYTEYLQRFNERKATIQGRIDDFIQVYPDLVRQARYDLGEMFNSSDYPSSEKVLAKFEIDVTFLPVPAGNGDFRVHFSDNQLSQLRASVKAQVFEAETGALKDAWGRLRKVVGHMVDKLKDTDSRFHDTLVGNVIELCELLPKMNIWQDPALDQVASELVRQITFSPDDLRKKPMIRQYGAVVGQSALNAIDERLKEIGLL